MGCKTRSFKSTKAKTTFLLLLSHFPLILSFKLGLFGKETRYGICNIQLCSFVKVYVSIKEVDGGENVQFKRSSLKEKSRRFFQLWEPRGSVKISMRMSYELDNETLETLKIDCGLWAEKKETKKRSSAVSNTNEVNEVSLCEMHWSGRPLLPLCFIGSSSHEEKLSPQVVVLVYNLRSSLFCELFISLEKTWQARKIAHDINTNSW